MAEIPRLSAFERLSSELRRGYGLDFGPDRMGFTASRLADLIEKAGAADLESYLEKLLQEPSKDLSPVVDRLTTSYTGFFRSPRQFRLLRDRILPGLAEQPRVRIWSAGCASGEEPYSILIAAAEEWGLGSLERLEILATDVSSQALRTAARGQYPVEAAAPLGAPALFRYFLRGRRSSRGWVKIKPELRRRVRFERLNLVDSFSHLPRFDLIVCANVMIYFVRQRREPVASRLAERLRPGGFLFLGEAETLPASRLGFTSVGTAVYRRNAE